MNFHHEKTWGDWFPQLVTPTLGFLHEEYKVSLSLFDSTVSSFKSYTLHRTNSLFQDGNVLNIPKQFLQNDQFSYDFLTMAHTVDGSEILEKPVGMNKTS